MLILKLIGLSVALLALAMMGLGITMLIKRNGKFPETHVGHNKEMRKRKIYCAKTFDRMEQNKVRKELRRKSMAEKLLVANNNDDSPVDYGSVTLAN